MYELEGAASDTDEKVKEEKVEVCCVCLNLNCEIYKTLFQHTQRRGPSSLYLGFGRNNKN